MCTLKIEHRENCDDKGCESIIFLPLASDFVISNSMMGGGEIHLNYDLNRIKYVIMNIMLKHKAVDHMHSMSCYEISSYEGQSKVSTIYKHIRILESYGLVKKGAKVERAYGYILTEEGIKVLPTISREEE